MKDYEKSDLNIKQYVSGDGSNTLFNSLYQESYHSLKDGAVRETMQKHVLPPIQCLNLLSRSRIRILDICFGLGYNSFFTLYQYLKMAYPGKIEIYSPEKDLSLIQKLLQMSYPAEIEILDGERIENILTALQQDGKFEKNLWKIECFWGDALDYLQSFDDHFFDLVYQDAFSPDKNPDLWSDEYFLKLSRILKEDGTITTYSQKGIVRDRLKRLGFYVYEIKHKEIRNSRIFSRQEFDLPFLIRK